MDFNEPRGCPFVAVAFSHVLRWNLKVCNSARPKIGHCNSFNCQQVKTSKFCSKMGYDCNILWRTFTAIIPLDLICLPMPVLFFHYKPTNVVVFNSSLITSVSPWIQYTEMPRMREKNTAAKSAFMMSPEKWFNISKWISLHASYWWLWRKSEEKLYFKNFCLTFHGICILSFSSVFYCGSDLKLIFGFGWKLDTMTVIYY